MLKRYSDELAALVVPDGDDLLATHKDRALSLSRPAGRAAMEARKHGKEGRHEQAVRIYRELAQQGELTAEDRISYGWELSHAIRDILKAGDAKELPPTSVGTAKQYLNAYLKLDVPRPELLHSRILQQALKLAANKQLRLVPFLRLWQIEHLRADDFVEFRTPDGKTIPSLAERAIQTAANDAAASGLQTDIQFIRPHVESAIARFPENAWLKLNMVKILRAVGEEAEARILAVDFARSKSAEYWTWELLGDLAETPALQRSCYAKALSCSQDDLFVGKVRLKFAGLIFEDHPGEARAEVERVIAHRTRLGQRIPESAGQFSRSAWFGAAEPVASERSFYLRFTREAEELLFAHLPWLRASLGESFVIDGRDGKKDRRRRRIYVKAGSLPTEVSVAEPHPDLKELPPGAPLRVQMETPPDEPWRTTIHRVRQRGHGAAFDVVPTLTGVIDHVNLQKGLAHVVVAKGVDGTFALTDIDGPVQPGQYVGLRAVRYHSRQGPRIRILSVEPTTSQPGPDVCRSFAEAVRVPTGNGFTDSGIFIPRDLVARSGIDDGDHVEGLAVISYDKTKSQWSWKAAVIDTVRPSQAAAQ